MWLQGINIGKKSLPNGKIYCDLGHFNHWNVFEMWNFPLCKILG